MSAKPSVIVASRNTTIDPVAAGGQAVNRAADV